MDNLVTLIVNEKIRLERWKSSFHQNILELEESLKDYQISLKNLTKRIDDCDRAIVLLEKHR